MPLKNKDGTPYKLSAPYITKPEVWSDNIVFHDVEPAKPLDEITVAKIPEPDTEVVFDIKVMAHGLTKGKKFIFPLIVTGVDDFQFEFWSSDPNGSISRGTIIYPFAYEIYDKQSRTYSQVPYDEYRWWIVMEKTEDEIGYMFKSILSKDQPDFSD